MNNAKIGTAVLGGYVLGRTKKAKLAISLGALLAGSRFRPGQLAKTVQESPFLNTLTNQVRTELADAGKAAATSVLTAKADSLANALHERTAGLREKVPGEGDRDTDEEPEDETGRDETERAEAERAEAERAEAERAEAERAEAERAEAERAEAERAEAERAEAERAEAERPRKKRTPTEKSTDRSRPRGGAARSRRPDDG